MLKIKNLLLSIVVIFAFHSTCNASKLEQLQQMGYLQINDEQHNNLFFESLYASFDDFITFVQANTDWYTKIYCAKERFIRSKIQKYYATNFFGLYDESQNTTRNQISFYYSTHFHEFICMQYPNHKQIPQINNFLNACLKIKNTYNDTFNAVIDELKLKNILSVKDNQPPILLKIIKYLPGYLATKPHYDGSALSFFINSSDNQRLLLSPYKNLFNVTDFFSPDRKFKPNSIVLIPGTLLTEFCINPTPHIVLSGKSNRYAIIAFIMRPNYEFKKRDFTILPNFMTT